MPFIVYLTCFSQVLSMAGFAAWPIYLIDLQNLWSLTNLEAGWISGAFFFGYIFATPFLVGLTDSYDSKKVYFISSLICLLYTSPSPRDKRQSRMPSSA